MSGEYRKATNDYIILNHQSKEMMLVHADGQTQVLPSVTSYTLPFTSCTPIIKSLSDDGSEIILYDSDFSTAKPYLARLRFEDTTATIEQLPLDSFRLNQRITYVSDEQPILIPMRISNGFTPFLPDTNLAYVGRGATWKLFGKREPMFYDTLLARLAWMTIAAYDNRVFICHNFTDYIDEYDFNGEYKQRIPITVSEEILNQLNVFTDQLEAIATRPKSDLSFGFKLVVNNLLIDTTNQIGCLTLAFKLGSIRNSSIQYAPDQFQFLALIIDMKAGNQVTTVQLPAGAMPLTFTDGVLHELFVDKGAISIISQDVLSAVSKN